MNDFAKRRDRFEFFNAFESPLLNLTFRQEVPNFLGACKDKGIPPFHFFLYCVYRALEPLKNFRYRFYQGQVICIEQFIASYTVTDKNGNLNFTRFQDHPDLYEFIRRSLEAKVIAENTEDLGNTGHDLGERAVKDYVFITSIPWLDFTAIQHPVFKFKGADIPSIAWGRFKVTSPDKIEMPFSVQAHHGFVDGIHINQLSLNLSQAVKKALTLL